MSSAIGIQTAVANPRGTGALITLSGRPSGLLRFRVGRTPDPGDATVVEALQPDPALPYSVDLWHPDLWYIWAQDDHGVGEQGQAVWLDCSWATDIGSTVAGILEQHRLGLDVRVKQAFPQSQMKSIQYGYAPNITDWPSIVVTNPRWSWQWVGFPYLRDWTFSFTVGTMLVRPDEANTLGFSADLAVSVMRILSIPRYNRMETPGGLQLFNVLAQSGDSQEVQIDDVNFGAVGSVQWSGQFRLQDTGQ